MALSEHKYIRKLFASFHHFGILVNFDKFGAAMYGFKEVDVQGLEQLKASSDCMLIDVRTDAEVSRGGIEGAVHIPLHLLPLKAQDLPNDRPVVFYCQSGGRSAQACSFVASKGVGEVYNLQGGIMGWIRSGKPLASI